MIMRKSIILILMVSIITGCAAGTSTANIKSSSEDEIVDISEENISEGEDNDEHKEEKPTVADLINQMVEEEQNAVNAQTPEIYDDPLMFVTVEVLDDRAITRPKSEADGLNDNTVIGSMRITFGEICTAEEETLNEEIFPKELFRQFASCELTANGEYLEQVDYSDIIVVLSYMCAMAYEFRDVVESIQSVTMPLSNEGIRIFEMKLKNGDIQEWTWNMDTNDFFIGEDGKEKYDSTMFNVENRDVWITAILVHEMFALGMDVSVEITGKELNVRNTPGTKGERIGITDVGAVFTLRAVKMDLEDTTKMWYEIDYDGQVGYVISDYAEIKF